MTGDRFAPVFKYFHSQLKLADPTAKIIGTSLLNWDWTCLGCGGYQSGQAWYEDFVSAYERLPPLFETPPVDVWAIDAYPIDWVRTPNSALHAQIVIDQLTGMRQRLDSDGYVGTPIWVTEIAIHVGYDGWDWDPSSTKLVPRLPYHPDKMSDYMNVVLDWLDANWVEQKIEKWFFFITWKDIVNVGPDGYMGLTFFNGGGHGESLNCLGEVYRARSLGNSPLACDFAGDTVPADGP
jgi:hypothetical protein